MAQVDLSVINHNKQKISKQRILTIFFRQIKKFLKERLILQQRTSLASCKQTLEHVGQLKIIDSLLTTIFLSQPGSD